MLRILGLDPGSEHSAFVFLEDAQVLEHGWVRNGQLLQRLRDGFAIGSHLAIETLHPRGELASLDAMETQLWAGRFVEIFDLRGDTFTKIDPMDARIAVCGKSGVKDREIKQALINRYGGDQKAIGGVRCPNCNDGKVWHLGPCPDCGQAGEVQGPRGPKKCPRCKGRTNIRERVACETCKGTNFLYPPGVLAGFNGHEYSALAAAICYIDLPEHRKRR
jgi:hypothetical protein